MRFGRSRDRPAPPHADGGRLPSAVGTLDAVAGETGRRAARPGPEVARKAISNVGGEPDPSQTTYVRNGVL